MGDLNIRQRHGGGKKDNTKEGNYSTASNTSSSPSPSTSSSVASRSRVMSKSSSLSTIHLALSAVVGSILTVAILFLCGRIASDSPVIHSYPHHHLVTYKSNQIHSTRARPSSSSQNDSFLSLETVIWERPDEEVSYGMMACIPPTPDSSAGEHPNSIVQFRGRSHRGLISSHHTSERMTLVSKMKIAWVADGINVGIHTASKSSPVVDTDDMTTGRRTLYVGSDHGRLYAMDADTGAQRWVYHTRSAHFGIHGTPAVDRERVYISDYAGWMTALNKTTGALVWEVQLGHSIGASPMLIGERLCSGIELNRPRANGYIACVERRTGTPILFSEMLGDHTHGTPTIAWRVGPNREDWSSQPPKSMKELTSHTTATSKASTSAKASSSTPTPTPNETGAACAYNVHCPSILVTNSSSTSDSSVGAEAETETDGHGLPASLVTSYASRVCSRSESRTLFDEEWRRGVSAKGRDAMREVEAKLGPYKKTRARLATPSSLFLIGANTGVLAGVDALTGEVIWKFHTFGALARPLLVQVQKARRDTLEKARLRHKERTRVREKAREKRLQEAKEAKLRQMKELQHSSLFSRPSKAAKESATSKSSPSGDVKFEWTDDDQFEFDSAEAERDEEEEVDDAEQADLNLIQDERLTKSSPHAGDSSNNNDIWLTEDTAELCRRANLSTNAMTRLLCHPDMTRPWLYLLNNKENNNKGQLKGTVAFSGHIAVVVSWDSFAYGVDLNDGRLVWWRQTKSLGMSSAAILPMRAYQPTSSFSSATAAAGSLVSRSSGMVFIGTHEWAIYALNLATGEPIWRYATKGKVMSSGVLTERKGNKYVEAKCGWSNHWVLIWGTFDGAIHELCASNGALLSKRYLQSGAISNEIAVHRDSIFVSTNGGRVIAFKPA